VNERTRLVAVTHVSNSLGTINPIKEIVERAHKYGVPVLIDGAQAAPHMLAMYRIWTAISMRCPATRCLRPRQCVVYGKAAWLEQMNPFQGGGDMIKSVTFEKTIYAISQTNLKPARLRLHRKSVWRGHRLPEHIGREKAAAYEHELLVLCH